MVHSRSLRKLAMIGLLGIPALLIACSSGVAKADYDAAKQQAASEQQKAAALQQQLSAKVQEANDLQKKLTDKDKELADAKKSSLPKDVTVLISAKGPLPPLPPPPAPTATPPGYVAPPRPAMPESYKQPVDFSIYVETLLTTRQSELGYVANLSCVPSGAFKRGQRIVWRFEVFDMKTGKRLTDLDGATVKVVIPNGDQLTARFTQRAGGRVPDAPWTWNAFWDVPLNYPIGGLGYSITVATKDGRNFTWKEPALVGGGTDSRVQIFE